MARSRLGRRSDCARMAVAVALALAGLGAVVSPARVSAASSSPGRAGGGSPAWQRYVVAPPTPASSWPSPRPRST